LSYIQPNENSNSRLAGLIGVVVFHVVMGYALVNGLARKIVEVVAHPLETKIIEEIKPPPQEPPPPPPPPPKLAAPPPYRCRSRRSRRPSRQSPGSSRRNRVRRRARASSLPPLRRSQRRSLLRGRPPYISLRLWMPRPAKSLRIRWRRYADRNQGSCCWRSLSMSTEPQSRAKWSARRDSGGLTKRLAVRSPSASSSQRRRMVSRSGRGRRSSTNGSFSDTASNALNVRTLSELAGWPAGKQIFPGNQHD